MIPPSPLGASLSCAPASFPKEIAAQAAFTHFGLAGILSSLTSERDVNYRLITTAGSFVLKLANPAEPPEVTDFQTQALLHLTAAALPTPRVIRTLSGATEVLLPQGILRVLTYLEGALLHRAAPSAALRRSMGTMAARLAIGLQGFVHPAAAHHLQWDIKQASALRSLLADVPQDLRPLCSLCLDRFDAEIAPRLADLRWQVVHGDLNPHNILTAPDETTISGILDFGDMVCTPLVCDLAVAASYQLDPINPLASLIEITQAYHATLPFCRDEAALVIPLIETRWLTTLCITAHRVALYPDNAAYILRNVAISRAGLLAFARLDRARATETLLSALRFQ